MSARALPEREARRAERRRLERTAHDLNNLLMAIVGNCDLLERGVLGAADAARAIRGAAEVAAALTETLADADRSSRVARAS